MPKEVDSGLGIGHSISLPKELVEFFKPRDHYIPHGRGSRGTPITYKGVVGEKMEDVPPEMYKESKEGILREEFRVSNSTQGARDDATRLAEKALTYLFGRSSYEDIVRYHMINTGTVPIKLKWRTDGKRVVDEAYIKKPDSNRIIGKFLYDIVSGHKPTSWAFNEHVYIEEGVQGNPLSRLNEALLLNDSDYLEGLVRASVHADFLAMAGDVGNPRNRIIQTHLQRSTILFDFDLMFYGWGADMHNPLLSSYVETEGLPEQAVDIFFDERFNVARRVLDQEDTFFQFVGLIGEAVDRTTKSVDQRIRENYPFDDAFAYFEERLDEFRK